MPREAEYLTMAWRVVRKPRTATWLILADDDTRMGEMRSEVVCRHVVSLHNKSRLNLKEALAE